LSQKGTIQNSQNLKESNQSHCHRNFEKSYKSKSKEKGLGSVFTFSQSGLPYSHQKRIFNHCSYSRWCGTKVPRRSVCTDILCVK
jgi:hypothetical protein